MSANMIKPVFSAPRPIVVEVEAEQIGVVDGAPVFRMLPTRFTMVLPIVWEWTDPDKTCEYCGEHQFALDHYFSLN